MTRSDKVNVLGVPVQALTMDSILSRIEELIETPQCAVILAVNAYSLNLTYRSSDYHKALQDADIVYADGASVLLAARILGQRLPERLTTTDIWPLMCEVAEKKGYKFFLLGGKEGLMARAAEKAREGYPELKIVGTHHGFFDREDESVPNMINAAQPDILWVGMGDPHQALWSMQAKEKLNAGMIITCGGMFKIVSGQLKRVNEKWRRRGFEWLFRLLREPPTWRRYLIGLPAFGVRVLGQRFFGHRTKLPESPYV